MICILEIGLLIVGIIVLITGKFKLSQARVATGAAARIAGLVIALPLPLNLAAGIILGLLSASQGKQSDIGDLLSTGIIVELGTVVACVLLASTIVVIAARPREDIEPRRRVVPKELLDEDGSETPASVEETIPHVEMDENSATGITNQRPQRPQASGAMARGPARRKAASARAARPSDSRLVLLVLGGAAAGFVFCVIPVGGLLVWWLYSTISPPQPSSVPTVAQGRQVAEVDGPRPDQKQAWKQQNQQPPRFDRPPGAGPQPPGFVRPPGQMPGGGANPPGTQAKPVNKQPQPADAAKAERSILPPIRSGPAIPPPRLAADKVEKVLPSTIADVAVGGGGRYLILHLSQERKLAVFDVGEARIKGYVPVAGGAVKFAAGREKLLVALGGENLIQRWDLATLRREATAPLPLQFKLSLIAMGSNSDGPLLVASADGIWRPEMFFMDIKTLKKMPIEKTGEGHIHIMEGDGVRVSADGRVFGMWSIHMGKVTLILHGNEARGYHENGLPGHLTPGPDGKVIYTAAGRYTNHIKPLADRGDGAPYCLPAVEGDYYLTVKTGSPQGRDKSVRGTLAVHLAGDERPLVALPEMDLPANIHDPAQNSQTLPADKRIYFIPAAKLLVTIPDSSDRLVLHRFDVVQALEKSEIDYLLVVSQPPVQAKKGATYRYPLAVKSKRGGVKYRLESGPEGMTISESGVLTWDVPRDIAESEINVIVTIRDRSGQEIFHTFAIVPGD